MLVAAYGWVIQGPIGASAVWNGVIDSASSFSASLPGVVGRTPTTAATLYFHKGAAIRTVRFPASASGLAASLQAGDTLRVVVGWGWTQDTALALGVTRNRTVLLDTATVIGQQRQRSNRIGALGAVMALLGVALLVRRRTSTPDGAVEGAPAGPAATAEKDRT